MPSRFSLSCPSAFARAGAALALASAAALPALAQYKVVGPDGRVTYTDRAPAAPEGTVTSLGARAAATPVEVELPFELRQAVSRYPVTLYVLSGACEPCELGRSLLRERGVPHAEKQVQSAQDVETLEKLIGSRDTPALTIGSQVVRGMSPEAWNSYLDAAGYPRESRLPAAYQPRPPTPVAERPAAAAPAPTPRQEVAPVRVFQRPSPTSGGIRF